jgi:hypothetical protein
LRVSPGCISTEEPVNAGGWFDRGVTVIGSTSVATRPLPPFADDPSVTSNEIDALP